MMVRRNTLRGLAVMAVCALGFIPALARAQSPLALRLGMYGGSTYNSRELADNKGFHVGLQYNLSGVPHVLNGEAWSTNISVDYYHPFTDQSDRFHMVPVAINQIYTFEEQNGKTPYLGFSLIAATFKSNMVTPNQDWVTRVGGGIILGLNLNEKMFVEGRYEVYDKSGLDFGGPDGFRATFGLRF